MDYSKIKLENERSTHVTKRLNRLTTWKFFKVLYRENVWRLFGYSLLMILCLAPIFVVLMLGSFNRTGIIRTLPALNGFGFSTGSWLAYNDYYQSEVLRNNIFTGWMAVVASVLMTLVLSGGLAVIRDAFWTGKLSTVGVFRSIGKGIKANIFYAFISAALIALSVFGIYAFFLYVSVLLPLWATIILTVVLGIIDMFFVLYLLIVCSVSVCYKQSIRTTLDDSWRLMWLNILPNLVHLLLALLPIVLYFIFRGGILQQLYLIFLLMFGGMYFPLVWQTHMMHTFALFHPVEKKKKNAAQQRPAQQIPSGDKRGKKGGKQGNQADEDALQADEQPSDDGAAVTE